MIEVGLADWALDDCAPVDSTDEEPEPAELDSFLDLERPLAQPHLLYLPLITR